MYGFLNNGSLTHAYNIYGCILCSYCPHCFVFLSRPIPTCWWASVKSTRSCIFFWSGDNSQEEGHGTSRCCWAPQLDSIHYFCLFQFTFSFALQVPDQFGHLRSRFRSEYCTTSPSTASSRPLLPELHRVSQGEVKHLF